PLAERLYEVRNVPPLFDRRVIRKRGHRRAVHARRKRPEDVLDVVGILAAPSEVPALVPARRLDGESPVIFQVERVPVSPPIDAMALDAFLVHHELSAFLDALLARRNRLDAIELKHRQGFSLLVVIPAV